MEEMCRSKKQLEEADTSSVISSDNVVSLDESTPELHVAVQSSHSTGRPRRSKRQKQSQLLSQTNLESKPSLVFKKKRVSELAQRHEHDATSGGIGSIIPSLLGVLVLGGILLTRSGFRGRATVAGIDLGTTNSVVCVQEQAAKEGVGKIQCIPDPISSSSIIPSVVSFLDPIHPHTSRSKKSSDVHLYPHPDDVLVGDAAKKRIDTHPHHTLYHAKRVLGRSFQDPAVSDMMKEVEFKLVPTHGLSMNEEAFTGISFEIPMHHPPRSSPNQIYTSDPTYIQISPQQVGSYVVHYLMTLTRKYLGHDNIKSAVIAVPAKFDTVQRAATVEAFRLAGIQVARILEEPVAAALAYGLQKKANVDYIIVYDFGGGTLDVSILQVSKDGYVEVMGSDGDENLGGADFDAAVAHYLLDGVQGKRKEVNRVMAAVQVVKQQQWTTQKHEVSNIDFEEKLLSECPVLHEWPLCTLSSFHTISEQMKIELSSHEVGGGTVSKVCLGFPSSEGLSWEPPQTMGDFCSQLQPLTLTLTPEEYDLACHSLYDRSMLPIRRLLGDLELGAKDIDEVVMVGGTTRMPKIRKMVRDELFISDLNTHIDPDLTVAIGAASVID